MSANLLGTQTSPYLLQHKDNPVHWRPWGPEAFAAAKAEHKPILLSVGYAACHWCHVMAHESFEDDATAAVMNRSFISIKVDREERPDVDAIYQSALALMGEQGGWPLTMFLTPDGAPFWGGTYFPPSARYGRPAFKDVLAGVAETWAERPEKIDVNVAGLGDALARLSDVPEGDALSLPSVEEMARRMAALVDPVDGGLRGAPKFPQPSLFRFLWHSSLRTGAVEPRRAVLLTLERLCQGGIYDHLGGGFARYSTDPHWLVPHFEKMLYDNAQLIELLTEAWQATQDPLFAQRVDETVAWLQREMRAEAGTFAATLDADSEGSEGRFYVWDAAELRALLPPDQAAAFMRSYDVRPGGNWEGRTILNRSHGAAELSEPELAACRAILFKARSARVRPGRDDKVLADWNGLTIAALARAGFAFDRPEWLTLARAAFDGVVTLLGDGDRLGHAYRLGQRQTASVLDDYAAMARAALTLFEVSGEACYLESARRWAATADALFADPVGGGYYFTPADAADLIVRTRSAHDTAVPSGNGLMAEVLVRLHLLTGEAHYGAQARRLFAYFSGLTQHQPTGSPSLLDAFAMQEAPLQLVIIGPADDPRTRALLRVAARTPELVLRCSAEPVEGKTMVAGAPAAYVCRGPTCQAPVAAPDALRTALRTR
jgi:uncharacterized protein YyaL (SSP411 family)